MRTLALGSLLVLALSQPSLQAPSDSDWSALNKSVDGRLFTATPFSLPCFKKTESGLPTSFDDAECEQVKAGYFVNTARQAKFGAFENVQWETCQATGEHCLLSAPDLTTPDPSVTCSIGSIPPYAIDVRSAEDVKAALSFAKKHKVPLVVKNSGHDYSGRSSGPGSLALWTRNLDSLSFSDSFVPAGCPSAHKSAAVTMGAGVATRSLISFADQHNVTIATGADATVGFAGGYTMGGGHSLLSNALGLSADRVLEVEVVTPTGETVVANACKNEDLFFAHRGGGGGTFGVVLSMTVRALPAMSISGVHASIPITPELPRKYLHFLIDHSLEFAKQGWGGVSQPQTGEINFGNPVLNEADARKTIQPLKDFVESNGGTFEYAFTPSYKAFTDAFQGTVPVGMAFGISSRLVPASLFETAEGRAALFDAIEATLEMPVTFLFAQTPWLHGDRGGTSFNPTWYESLWHVPTVDLWGLDATVDDVKAKYERLGKATEKLRLLTPPGAYPNEADVYEPDFGASFWGEHYTRLLEIKNKYDPDHILDCWQCVGWLGQDDPRYKCYIPVEVPKVAHGSAAVKAPEESKRRVKEEL